MCPITFVPLTQAVLEKFKQSGRSWYLLSWISWKNGCKMTVFDGTTSLESNT